MSWNIKNEIIKQEQKFLKSGGKFIIPFPKPKIIIESSFEHVLKGLGNGASELDNYDTRNEDFDWNTKFFLENKQKFSELNISLHYILSNLLRLKSTISISETFNPYLYSESQRYREYEFILGLDFQW